MRLPKQVLVIPYRVANDKIEYCIFKRSDMDAWQWIAGGMEDFDNDIFVIMNSNLFIFATFPFLK